MLSGITDPFAFHKFERSITDVPPKKFEKDNGCIVYECGCRLQVSTGPPSISGLSEARFGDDENTGVIMRDTHMPPEVILDMPWSYPVDVWGLGIAVSYYPTVLLY